MFQIDIERCEHCGGRVKIIASIEDPRVIRKTLAHLERQSAQPRAACRHYAGGVDPPRASP